MTLTQKETTLLSDLKSQEQLCVEKYNKYSQMAHDPELKNLFSTLSQNEQKHLDTVTQILNGNEVKMPESHPLLFRQSCSARCLPVMRWRRKATLIFVRMRFLWKSTCLLFTTPVCLSFQALFSEIP